MTEVEILVVGGGPAGLASALALRQRGLDVLVVEAGDYQRAGAADTLRPEGKRVLRSLGVAEARFGSCVVEGRGIVSAWDRDGVSEQDFCFNPYGPAWHVERPAFDRALADAAERAGARLLRGADLLDLARDKGRWRARIDVGGDRLAVEARYVIDATGRAARIARRLGARRLAYDRQVALWRSLTPSRAGSMGSKLLLEAGADGWWYSIPLVGGRVLAAYLTDSDLLPRDIPLGEAWRGALAATHYTAARLDGADADPPMLRAAGVGRLTAAAGPGWLAVGDAAATLDPLSGSGLTEALLGGQRAAAALAADAAGDAGALARYAAAMARGFDAHLADRARYHARARHRADDLFWRRRRPVDIARAPITLDPMLRLGRAPAPAAAATARLEGIMPRQDIARLQALCAPPKEAHRVLAEFRHLAGAKVDAKTMIVALQIMIEERCIRAA